MKALIIYQDFASAMKANLTLHKLKLSHEFRIDWEVVPWRMDMLRFPPTATEALITATDAHLILFAGGFTESVPFWILDWLREWYAVRQIKDAALAVSASASGGMPSTSAISILRRFAAEHDLGFIIEPNDFPGTARLNPGPTDAPFVPSHRHWEINE